MRHRMDGFSPAISRLRLASVVIGSLAVGSDHTPQSQHYGAQSTSCVAFIAIAQAAFLPMSRALIFQHESLMPSVTKGKPDGSKSV